MRNAPLSKRDIPSIVNSLKAHVRNPVLCKDFVLALHGRLFDDEKEGRHNFHLFILNTTGGIASLLAAMEHHAAESSFLEVALVFVYNLMHYGGKKSARVVAKLVKRGAGRVTVAIVNRNLSTLRVLQAATMVLVALSSGDSKLSTVARLTGCIGNMLSLLRNSHTTMPSDVLSSMLSCLCALCKTEINLTHLGKKGGVTLALDVISKHLVTPASAKAIAHASTSTSSGSGTNSGVIRYSTQLLLQMMKIGDLLHEAVQSGAVALMLAALVENLPETQKVCLEALSELAKTPDGQLNFAAGGGYPYVSSLVITNNVSKKGDDLLDLVVQLYRFHDVTVLPVGDDNNLRWVPPSGEEIVPSLGDSSSDAADSRESPTAVPASPVTVEKPPVDMAMFSPELHDWCVPPETVIPTSIVVHHVKPFADVRPTPSCPSAMDFVPPVEELLMQTEVQRTELIRAELRRLVQPDKFINCVVYDDLERSTVLPKTHLGHPAQQQQDKDSGVVPNSIPPSNGAAEGSIPALTFSSNFESGNLKRAIRIFDNEYDLILHPDVNTVSHVQWFFFCIENMRSDVTYKFNIINMEKPSSSYSLGQRPLLFSEKRFTWSGFGWLRGGHNIVYMKNSYRRPIPATRRSKKNAGGCTYYTLTFSVRFPHDEDRVYVASCYPYTYSDLIGYLRRSAEKPAARDSLTMQSLCLSQCGNHVPMVTITARKNAEGAPCSPEEIARRMVVVISARVHPGETNSSYMARGVIDYLLDSCEAAALLRESFVWKIVPMLNVDGVINGNHRCSIAGKDLNRVFLTPARESQSSVYYLKELIRNIKCDEHRNIILYGDFHGHSRRNNSFCFGCGGSRKKLTSGIVVEKLFPRLLSELVPYFSYSSCTFKVNRAKETTGRVVFYREFGIRMSFTVEASMMGGDGCDFVPLSFSDVEENISRRTALARMTSGHFNVGHYATLGAMFVKAVGMLVEGERQGGRASDVIVELMAEAAPDGGKKVDRRKMTSPLEDDLSSNNSSLSGAYAQSRRSRNGSLARRSATAQVSPQDVVEVYRVLLHGPMSAAKPVLCSDVPDDDVDDDELADVEEEEDSNEDDDDAAENEPAAETEIEVDDTGGDTAVEDEDDDNSGEEEDDN